MAIYTMFIKRAHDPLSGAAMDMWGVYDDEQENRCLAYCPRSEDAERIKALLVEDGAKGFTVHLHLDGREWTKMLVSHIVRELPSVIRNTTSKRSF